MNVESKNPPKLKLITPDAYRHRMMVSKRERETEEYFAGLEKVRERKKMEGP